MDGPRTIGINTLNKKKCNTQGERHLSFDKGDGRLRSGKNRNNIGAGDWKTAGSVDAALH